jgi:hypothetical protein
VVEGQGQLQRRPAPPLPAGLRVALPPAVVLPGGLPQRRPVLSLLALPLSALRPVQPVALPQASASRA